MLFYICMQLAEEHVLDNSIDVGLAPNRFSVICKLIAKSSTATTNSTLSIYIHNAEHGKCDEDTRLTVAICACARRDSIGYQTPTNRSRETSLQLLTQYELSQGVDETCFRRDTCLRH